MSGETIDELLDLLDVRLDAFAMCELESSSALRCDPMDTIVVHFVLSGTGFIECEHGRYSLRPGIVVVVSRNMPKTITGAGPISRTIDVTATCPLIEGMVKFGSCDGEAGLVLGCASVTATVGAGYDLFDKLRQPIVEDASSTPLRPIFEMISGELSHPAVGTRAVAGALMKHVLISVLRSDLKRSGTDSPFYMPMMDPRLGKALTAIMLRPEDPHCVDSLARIAGMSRSRFAHHFARTYGRAPMDFVQSIRLAAARKLLRGSDLPIKSVAAAVGYASRSHFSRAFRAEFGVDPTAFRLAAAPAVSFEAAARESVRLAAAAE